MNKVINSNEMKKIDQHMIHINKIPGIILMENAAMNVSNHIYNNYKTATNICVLCGIGNNGGDGFAIARQLIVMGYEVKCLYIGDESKMSEDTLTQKMALDQINTQNIIHLEKDEISDNEFNVIRKEICATDLIIDAMFGIGLTRNVTGTFKQIIDCINESGKEVTAVDIPSGINADTGQIEGSAINAKTTITFQHPKIGHYIYPGRANTGKLIIAKIGIDKGFTSSCKSIITAYDLNNKPRMLPKRKTNSNKGTFGKLGIIAGTYEMAGACTLACNAAFKSGAGLVSVGSSSYVTDIIQKSSPLALVCPFTDDNYTAKSKLDIVENFLEDKNAIVLGPGIGSNTEQIVEYVIKNYTKSLVLDADGLNSLSLKWLKEKKCNVIITPHPKELSRLINIPLDEILSSPIEIAKQVASEYKITVLLKGATTIIAHPSMNGNTNVSLVLTGNDGMAKGGSGDVLSGVIGSLCAQNISTDLAGLLGAFICGHSADIAKEKSNTYSITPLDTIDNLPNAFNLLS